MSNKEEISISPSGIHWIIPNFFKLLQKLKLSLRSPSIPHLDRNWNIIVSHGSDTADQNHRRWLSVVLSGDVFIPDEYIVQICITQGFCKNFINYRAEYMQRGAYGCINLISLANLLDNKTKISPDGKIHFHFKITEKKSSSPHSLKYPDNDDDNAGNWNYKQDVKNLYEWRNMADVVLNVQGKEFRAHKCILDTRCPVVLEKLTHAKTQNLIDVVYIEDVDLNVFPDFLRYIYTGDLDKFDLPEKVLNLLSISEKFQVNELKKICLFQLNRLITVDNFCDMLVLSCQNDLKTLNEACVKFFKKKSVTIVLTDKWKKTLCENPRIINQLVIQHLKNTQNYW